MKQTSRQNRETHDFQLNLTVSRYATKTSRFSKKTYRFSLYPKILNRCSRIKPFSKTNSATKNYGVTKWTKLPIPFRGVAAPLRGANHITVSSFLFRRGVVFSSRRVFVSSWRRVFVLSFLFRRGVVFLFHRGVVFSFCRFYFVVASCFRFVVFISSWGPVCFVLFVSSCRCDGT